MSLRVKLILALTLLASAATAAIGIASYTNTKHQLESSVDRSLDDAALRFEERPEMGDPDHDGDQTIHYPSQSRPRSFEQVLFQRIAADGTVVVEPQSGALPVTEADLAVAASTDPSARTGYDTNIDGEHYRVLTIKYADGAVVFARSLAESQNSLESILHSTLLAVAIVALVSAALGWAVAHGITRRLERLTVVAGVVASTGRLDVDVPTDGKDETGQLGRALSGMLSALHSSREEQHRLVQDASHELRTPLTSLRTNVSVLRRKFSGLDESSREQLLADLDSETRELTDLVNELVELATDRRDDELVQPVRLGDPAERAAARARRRTGRTIVVNADDTTIDGRPGALERAMQNLIDNACKFATDGDVEVAVRRGRVSVRDHGHGLREADIPHLFDRFYRSVEMRSRPGSGLGLAIVRSVVEAHGGEVFAANASGGGAVIGFTLPVER
jgi:two-component system sensor histidine kinase MprB